MFKLIISQKSQNRSQNSLYPCSCYLASFMGDALEFSDQESPELLNSLAAVEKAPRRFSIYQQLTGVS